MFTFNFVKLSPSIKNGIRSVFTSVTAITATVLFFGLAVSNPAHAQLLYGPTTRATGLTGRAALSGDESAFLNPATLAHVKAYSITGILDQSQGQAGTLRQWSGVFVDNNPDSIVPAAFSYSRTQGSRSFGPPPANGNNLVDEELYQLSFGNFIRDGLSVGFTGIYQNDKQETSDAYKMFNGNLGVLYTPIPQVGVGAVAYNVAPSRTPSAPSQYAIAGHYLYRDQLRARLDLIYQDISNPDKKLNWGIGLEEVFLEDIAARFGYRTDSLQNANFASIGLGWRGPHLGLDYAFETKTNQDNATVHSFDFRLLF